MSRGNAFTTSGAPEVQFGTGCVLWLYKQTTEDVAWKTMNQANALIVLLWQVDREIAKRPPAPHHFDANPDGHSCHL